MHEYKFYPLAGESDDEFRDRIEAMCDGKAVLAIQYMNNADDVAEYAKVTSFDEIEEV